MINSDAVKLFDELEGYYEETIAQMEDRFTSHEFIEKLSKARQNVYIQLLSEYSRSGQPFQLIDSELEARLRNFNHLVEYDKANPKSEHPIFGSFNSSAVWLKVK